MRGIRKFFYSPKYAPYFFVLPFIVSLCLFFVYPLIETFQMSFQDINGFSDVTWVGFKNYINLFKTDQFLNAVKVTLQYTFWTIFVLVPMPIILSVLLNSKMKIGADFFKSALFIPQLTSTIVAGIFFRYAFSDSETALINSIVGLFGIEPVAWLKEALPTMVVLVVLCSWRWMGVNIIYFLSGLQGISPELYESSSIDGANTLQNFWYITVPSLKPTIIYVITISVYGGFAMFSESYALFGSASTPGGIGTTMVGYIYQVAFKEARMGYGAAVGVVLLIIVLVLNLIQLTCFGSFKKED